MFNRVKTFCNSRHFNALILMAGITVVFMGALASTTRVAAHETVGSSGSSGEVTIHITPDDRPVAGSESTIYITTKTVEKDFRSASLKITDLQTNRSEIVPLSRVNTTLSTKYTFRNAGVQRLDVAVVSDKKYNFELSQRVEKNSNNNISSSINELFPAIVIGAAVIVAVGIIVVLRYFPNKNKQS